MSSDISKKRLLFLMAQMAVIAFLAVVCGWLAFFENFYDLAFQSKRNAIQKEVSRISADFSNQSKEILEYTELYSTLRGKSKVVDSDKKIFDYLSWIKHKFGADVVYLMSPTGNVIETTNKYNKLSFLGKNYSFRDYFIRAKENETFVQMGMGRTSGVPGTYYSAAIALTPEATKYVLVAKTNLVPSVIDKVFGKDLPFVIISSSNEILLSRDEDLAGKSVVFSKNDAPHIYGRSQSKIIFSEIANSSGWKIGVVDKQGILTAFFKQTWRGTALFLPLFIFLIFLGHRLVRRITRLLSEINAISIQRHLILSTFDSIENPIWIVEPGTNDVVLRNKACKNESIRAMCGANFEKFKEGSKFLQFDDRENGILECSDNRFYEFHTVLTPLDGKNYFINQLVDITDQVEYQSRKETEQAKMFHDERIQNMGRMISNISHELNNPLTSVIIGFDRLFSMIEDEKTEDVANLIRRNIERMNRVVRMLLAFVRQAKSNATDVAINEMFENCLILLGRELLASNIEVKKSGVEGVVLNCMPVAFETIILNFAKNSVDAFDDHPEIQNKFISFECVKQPSTVELIFSDNAGGIPDEIADKIFNPFFTTKSEGKGTGIGMHMTKELIKDMGGQVHLDRDYKDGARFVVSLPLKILAE